ncbi:MAG: hypothetical protein M1814_005803 [Vezdaea aestivalis]|nr:MAG: hypothetical protein M1814_005803 [Vezdaea aestivalis]
MSSKNSKNGANHTSMATNFVAGGGAGMMEALVCHPLDTIKVRMQLRRRSVKPGMRKGFWQTGKSIWQRETPMALYKGLGAVLTGIIPKMAIRFTAFERFKEMGAGPETGEVSGQVRFFAGLAAGVTEAVAVVNPMEVVKIRLQSQYHSLSDPADRAQVKYRNAPQAVLTVVREEGISALYRGVSLTAIRQGSNQAVNFYFYGRFKQALQDLQPQHADTDLPRYQAALCGVMSGAMGPLSNAPIDTIKTRLQGTTAQPGETALKRIVNISSTMFKQEGVRAFYKGITPRIIRVAPGQGVVFAVYEFLKNQIENSTSVLSGASYEE